jgi:hypothetical protein
MVIGVSVTEAPPCNRCCFGRLLLTCSMGRAWQTTPWSDRGGKLHLGIMEDRTVSGANLKQKLVEKASKPYPGPGYEAAGGDEAAVIFIFILILL